MPPSIALLLCSGFVLALLRIERAQSRNVSDAVWIPTLWMLSISSKPLGIWFGTTGDAETGSPLDRVVLSILLLAGITILIRRRFDWSSALRASPWLLLLFGYMLVSVLWSEITFIALKRWVREGAVLIMALVLLSERDPRAALESLLRRSVYLLLPFSLLLIKYYPAMGVDYGRWSGLQMWIGVTVHKNCLGRLCLIASFFLLWALYRRWKHGEYPAWRYQTLADAFLLLMAFYLLKGPGNAYSATSVATLGVGIVAFLLLVHFRRRQILVSNAALLALIAFLIAFGAATPFLGGANVASFTGSLGRNETLTGRTDTWVELVPVVKSRPFLGSGFSSFWTSARRELYGMSHGHNGYLDTLLDIGGVGMCLYAVFLLSCGSRLHSILGREYDWASLGICFLLMSLVYNVSESALNSLGEQMTAMLILSVLVIPAPYCRSVPDGDIGVGGLADTIASSKT